MEFTKENIRFFILIRCKLSESAKLIHETLHTVCRDCARWARRQTRRVASRISKPKERESLRYSSVQVAQDTTMTATYYVQNVLSQVKSVINEQRPKISTSRTLLLHDNASPHKARATTQSLRELEIQVLPHPA
ncbi:transposase [Elysia marginata]|uniref:Transposase n=1 Tax=Elysia marginata TaxID=1093978 RepID=A0AAV4FS96_9GAST|nr:transposase [Elysia marginata]